MSRYHRITLTFKAPWNLPGPTHDWHHTFSLSGASALTAANVEATALDLADPVMKLAPGDAYYTGYRYYPSGTNTSLFSQTYTTEHPCNGGAWTSASSNALQQLEVCVVARCPIGVNSKGRPNYLRKWIHHVYGLASDPNGLGMHIAPSTILAKWNTGCGPLLLVPVDPTDGTQGGPWTLETHLFTRQLRRGPKHKPPAASTNSIEIPPVP